ncbi:MAG TPA: SgcJ/EcaC family oxidoreductase [Lacipirellulaceae bacterium]|nr:SgcJ/EcaC family oxidoreductase [Lacipirellulaceae bacterium]
MRLTFLVMVLAVAAGGGAAGQEPASAVGDDEAAIRAAVESYVAAYNRGDVAALAAHWSENGAWISPSGERFDGRDAIAAAMGEMFAADPGATIEVSDVSIRMVSDDVAIEEGRVRVTEPDGATESSSYLAVHLKHDGQWKLHTVRETAEPEDEDGSDAPEGLAELAWMVGHWKESAPDATTETNVAWSKNRAFLTADFRVSAPGLDDLEGTQTIAWDPAAGVIRSWLFDFDGGVGHGVWVRDRDRWIVHFAQVLPDGRTASCANIYTMIDADHYTWQSVDRQVDGEPLPDVPALIVVRQSESPESSAPATE